VITAVTTGTVLVVLAMLIERCKALLKEHDMECDETSSTVDVLVPTGLAAPYCVVVTLLVATAVVQRF